MKFKESQEPWLQRNGETAEAYAAFSVYRDLGPRRSIDKAYRQHLGNKRATEVSELTMRASGRWTTWSVIFAWQARAFAYDRHLARIEMAKRERIVRNNGVIWAEERRADMWERLEICRNLRRGILNQTADGVVSDTRRKQRSRAPDGTMITVDEHLRLTDQLRLLLKLHATLFPPDAIEVDDETSSWSKFVDPEVLYRTSSEDAEPAEAAEPSTAGGLVSS